MAWADGRNHIRGNRESANAICEAARPSGVFAALAASVKWSTR